MKKIILRSLVVLGCIGMIQTGAMAQTEKEVIIENEEIKVTSNGDEVIVTLRGDEENGDSKSLSAEIRKTITELVVNMKAEIAEIRAKEAAGEITKVEMAEEIGRVAESYSEIIEGKVENFNRDNQTEYESELEWTLSDSIPSVEEEDEERIRIKMKGKPKPKKRTYTGFSLAFGWHTLLLNNPRVEGAIYPEVEFWQGGFSEIAFLLNTRLGGNRSPLYLNYGASLMYNRADIRGGNYLLENQNGPMFVQRDLDVREFNLRTAYVNGTIGFKIAPKSRKGFHIEANAYGGVLFRTKQDIEYRSGLGEDVTESRVGNYGVNRFNYGVSAAVGYRWVSIYARYDLSSLFEDTSVYDFTPLSVGFKFNLL